MNYCLECGKEVKLKTTKLCRSCRQKGTRNHAYKGIRAYCKICGVELSKISYTRCVKHSYTKERRKKQVLNTIRIHTGKKRSEETKMKLKEAWNTRRLTPVSEETRKKLSIAHKGEKNYWYGRKGGCTPNWLGGKSFEPYGLEFNDELREEVRERDNHTCQLCNKKKEENNQKLSIHHIDYDKKNNKEKNLITLCNSCHSKTNFQRAFWLGFLLGAINARYNYRFINS